MIDPAVPPSCLRIGQIQPHRAQPALHPANTIPIHYLVLVVTDADFPYALISVVPKPRHGGHWVARRGEDMWMRPGGESAEGSTGARVLV